MFRRPILWAMTATFLIVLSSSVRADWRRFRGPNGTGVAASGAPTEFSRTNNLKWQVELPGRGFSSPIVVGDKVFVTCYSGYGMGDGQGELEDLKRHLVCVDRRTGETRWTKTVNAKLPEDPYRPPGVATHGYASHTPVSDGERVYAFFGKSGVYAFDLDGNELWNQSVGTESGRMGFGSGASPVVFEDYVIVNASYESEAIIWLDKKTGEEKHRAEAAGLSRCWTTPVLMKNDEGTELVLSVVGEVWGLNAANGKFKWYSAGVSSRNAQVSVLAGDGIVYATGQEAIAVRTGGKGDVSESNIAWEGLARGSFATPVLHDGHIFSVNGSIVACLDASTGERIFQKRLSSGESVADEAGGGGRGRGGGGFGGGGFGRGRGGGFGGGRGRGDYASPVLADDKIYITTGAGLVYVIAAKPKYELLATNDMTFDSSGFGATPAISNSQLFMRSNTHLYCIAED